MDLPEEIIIKILEFVWENDKKSFERMAATSKLIRRISRDSLFTNCFKCSNCNTLDSALQQDHLTCYKWSYNKMTKPDVTTLCIDASKAGSLKVVEYLVSRGANIYAKDDYLDDCLDDYSDDYLDDYLDNYLDDYLDDVFYHLMN